MRLNHVGSVSDSDPLNILDVFVCEDKYNVDVITEESSQL